MKPRLYCATTFTLYLLASLASTICWVSYPTTAKAESSLEGAKENVNSPSIPIPGESPRPSTTPTSPVSAQSPILKILTPIPDSILDISSTSVILQFPVGSQVELRVNGQLVERSQIGRKLIPKLTW
jgi:hypothetical protein